MDSQLMEDLFAFIQKNGVRSERGLMIIGKNLDHEGDMKQVIHSLTHEGYQLTAVRSTWSNWAALLTTRRGTDYEITVSQNGTQVFKAERKVLTSPGYKGEEKTGIYAAGWLTISGELPPIFQTQLICLAT